MIVFLGTGEEGGRHACGADRPRLRIFEELARPAPTAAAHGPATTCRRRMAPTGSCRRVRRGRCAARAERVPPACVRVGHLARRLARAVRGPRPHRLERGEVHGHRTLIKASLHLAQAAVRLPPALSRHHPGVSPARVSPVCGSPSSAASAPRTTARNIAAIGQGVCLLGLKVGLWCAPVAKGAPTNGRRDEGWTWPLPSRCDIASATRGCNRPLFVELL